MISVFVSHSTPRLTYVLDFCFKDKGEEYQIITEKSEWDKIGKNRINYSERPLVAEVQLEPSKLLFEDFIRTSNPVNNDLLIDDKADDFALIFCMLTRYEEYLPHETDKHGRYISAQSIFVQTGHHRSPLADQITKKIWTKLELNYQEIQDRFECVPSFDIDVAWAYKYRGIPRSIGGFIKGKNKINRIKVALGREKDPYDTYSYINEISTRVDRIICFALLGDWGKYDKNIAWENEHYQSLIRGLNSSGGMGIHPSYNSYLKLDAIKKEIKRMETIVGHEIIKSRQHFLRLKFPDTYQSLYNAGIRREYSMGYADEIGFRAGTSFPYFFFNLAENKATDLLVFPFIYMDSALKDYLKLSVPESIELINDLVTKTRDVGGLFMCVWHNSSVNDLGEWKGWRDVLDETIKITRP